MKEMNKDSGVDKTQIEGHEYVDLGLPSGTLWATMNVGASALEECGDYFAWGETTKKKNYRWSTYKYGKEDDHLTKYCGNGHYGHEGFTDALTSLEAADDAATANWGSKWRMPTIDEWQELIDNCAWMWTTIDGRYGNIKVCGCKVESLINGNSIFLPVVGVREGYMAYNGLWGYYWSSSLYASLPDQAQNLRFGSVYPETDSSYRDNGLFVRPVVEGTTKLEKTRRARAVIGDVTVYQNSDDSIELSNAPYTDTKEGLRDLASKVGLQIDSRCTIKELGETLIDYVKNRQKSMAKEAFEKFANGVSKNNASIGETIEREYVDLGLPSGTLWATMNVGASAPEEYGDYFAWGETTMIKSGIVYKYAKGKNIDYNLTKYCSDGNYGNEGFTDALTSLEAADDAATVNWGAKWRTPTIDEWQELIDNCIWTRIMLNGIYGYEVKAANGNFIFLPAAGEFNRKGCLNLMAMSGSYWSNSLGTDRPDFAMEFSFYCYTDEHCTDYGCRENGHSVRPVVAK